MPKAPIYVFFFSSRRRHTRLQGDWSSDVCSSDLSEQVVARPMAAVVVAGRHFHADINRVQIRIDGCLSPRPGVAGVGPGILLPRVDSKFAGLGDGVERPKTLAG